MPATLRSLRIRNLALVESLEWDLGDGFNVVTGETGAGKSIILGALKLLLGERAEKSLIRAGADQCSVEACFELDDPSKIDEMLTGQGIDPCEGKELLLKRLFSISGSNRQFINGSQTTLATLKEIGDGLVDLHGPHDHQSLLSREQQLRLVDAYAGHHEAVELYHRAYRQLGQLQQQLDQLSDENSLPQSELWRHQLSELQNAEVRPGELDELQSKYDVAANARRILELTAQVVTGLTQADESVLNQVGAIGRMLRELERLDGSVSEMTNQCESVAVEIEELDRAMQAYQGRVEVDPSALRTMENRLNLLQDLKRKYQRDENGLKELEADLREKLSRFDRREEMTAELQLALNGAMDQVQKQAAQLTKTRNKASAKLSNEIRQHLKDLGFKQGHFDILNEESPQPGPQGSDQIEFLFAPNPGEPPKPLRAIASSGEISRVMLAIKTALAEQDLIGLLVFDEIDANVGGEIAHSVGSKMKALGVNRQVLAITHMPQVAAAATKHFSVRKEVSNGRTRTELTEVAEHDRIAEIARMLGGKTKSAMDHATELLRTHS